MPDTYMALKKYISQVKLIALLLEKQIKLWLALEITSKYNLLGEY